MRRTLTALVAGTALAALIAVAPSASAGKPDPMPNLEGFTMHRIATGLPCAELGGVLFTSDTSRRIATADLYRPFHAMSPNYHYGTARVIVLKHEVTDVRTGELVRSAERPGPPDRIHCGGQLYSSPHRVDVELAVVGRPPAPPTAAE